MTANGDHEFSLDPLERAAAEDTADVVVVWAAPARARHTRWSRGWHSC